MRLGSLQQLDKHAGRCAAAQQEQGGAPLPPPRQPEQPEQQALVGEDAAVFDLSQQSLRSWVLFGALLTGVLAMLYPVRQRRHPCLLPFFPRSLRAVCSWLLRLQRMPPAGACGKATR